MANNLPECCKPIIDIGANLTNTAFTKDIDETIKRAQQANVQKIIVTGTSVSNSHKASLLATKYPSILYSTAGIHPHDAKHFSNDSLRALKELALQPQVVAIGETGLDFCRNFSTPLMQVSAFEKQLELAIDVGLPLFLHERDAHKTQWEILKSYRDQLNKAVIHCFTGTREQVYRYLDLGLYIGITGWICDQKRGSHLQEFIAEIPLDRLMVETDAPYLMPKVKPGPAVQSSRRNEPCTLPYVINTIAKHSAFSEEIIATTTTTNATHFFGLPPT